MDNWIRIHNDSGFDVVEADYVQWMDFSMLTVPGLPAFGRKIFYGLLTAAGLPVIWLDRFLSLRPRSRRFSMGLVIAARKR